MMEICDMSPIISDMGLRESTRNSQTDRESAARDRKAGSGLIRIVLSV